MIEEELIRRLSALERKVDRLLTPEIDSAMTHVRATTAAGQSIPDSTWTTIIFGTEVYDTLGEYNPATGVFTARFAGYYHGHASAMFDLSTTWAATETAALHIYVDGVQDLGLGRETDHTAANIFVHARGGGTVYLTAGQAVDIRMFQNSGGALPLRAFAMYNWLTIDRLP